MPPKAAAVVARSPSPTPPPPQPQKNDANDILVIQDLMDTIDQIPIELTRVHSDLNELGAVLYSTLCNLETKLHQLINWIQDPTIGPERRFQLLQEIAEEAARYKLGGDDKIRVAGGACDGIMGHQRHISDLLNASSLLDHEPPSPYTAMLTLPAAPVPAATRRGGRTTGSPFNDRGTPTKKKRSRKDQIGKDDDDVSSVNGEKKKAPVKRKKPPRGASPSESIASASAYGKDNVPKTARQIAAAAAKARDLAAKQARADDSDEETGDDEPRGSGNGRKSTAMAVSASNDSMAPSGALGIDIGKSREGSASKGVVTPAGNSNKSATKRGTKRGHDDDDDEEEDDEDVPPAKRVTAKKVATAATGAAGYDSADLGDDGAVENDLDSKVYCTCRQVSFGEMIGCDDDDCEIEWYHVACLNLDKAPEGNWICPQCLERRKRNPKAKKPSKAAKRR